MKDLFKSEFLRYRKWALLVMASFLAAAVFVSRLEPFLDPNSESMAIISVILIFSSLVFGLAQMLLHRRTNHWTYLVHRPLAPQKIYIALMAAGTAALALAVMLPWAIMVIGLDLVTSSVVDTRHYAYVLYFFLVCCAAYLVGSLAALSANRGAILLAPLLFTLLLPSPDSTLSQFLPAIVMIGLLLTLNIVSFKPDLAQHLRRPWAIVLMAAPLCVPVMYGLVMSSAITYHIPKFILGTHPDNNPVEGTFRYFWNLDAAARVGYALEGSDHPQADHYSQQATLADTAILSTSAWPFPHRSQLHVKDHQYALTDRASNTVWQFSHDSMLLEGRHAISQQHVGAVGRNGFLDHVDAATEADRFQEAPVMVGSNLMATPEVLYQVDFAERGLFVKFQPAAGERMIGLPRLKEHFVSLATDKHLMLFDRRTFADEYQAASPDYVIPHPVDPAGVYYVQSYRMVDGYLLVYSGPDLLAFDTPGLVTMHARPGAEAELVHRRTFDMYAHPAWIRHFSEIVSPLTTILHDQTLALIDPRFSEGKSWTMERLRSYPAHLYWLALLLQITALLAVLWLARRHRLGARRTVTWVVMAGLIGLPIVVAFVMMNPWRLDTVAPEPSNGPATATA